MRQSLWSVGSFFQQSFAGGFRNIPAAAGDNCGFSLITFHDLTGVYHAAKSVVSIMKEQNYGKMVFISSIGGRTGRPGVGANYAAAKAGVVGNRAVAKQSSRERTSPVLAFTQSGP